MTKSNPLLEKKFPATGMPDADWWTALWPEPLDVLVKLGFDKSMTAVDLCCGDGLFTLPMAKLLDGRVYAIDLDPDMLSLAKQTLVTGGAPDIKWIQCDARDMKSFVPDPVDIVLIANTFHGVDEQTQMARSAYEVLKPGGKFIIVNWHVLAREETNVLGKPRGPRFDMRMSPQDVKNAVEPANLDFDKTVELPPYHYGAIFIKPPQ